MKLNLSDYSSNNAYEVNMNVNPVDFTVNYLFHESEVNTFFKIHIDLLEEKKIKYEVSDAENNLRRVDIKFTSIKEIFEFAFEVAERLIHSNVFKLNQ
jgi:hypothetical protein